MGRDRERERERERRTRERLAWLVQKELARLFIRLWQRAHSTKKETPLLEPPVRCCEGASTARVSPARARRSVACAFCSKRRAQSSSAARPSAPAPSLQLTIVSRVAFRSRTRGTTGSFRVPDIIYISGTNLESVRTRTRQSVYTVWLSRTRLTSHPLDESPRHQSHTPLPKHLT